MPHSVPPPAARIAGANAASVAARPATFTSSTRRSLSMSASSSAFVPTEMPALAITDLNNFFGLVKFFQATRSKGIKPIIGCDVFITNDADRERPYRLLLLCQSRDGYLLLCRLISRAYLENQHRGRAEFRREWFHQLGTDGLLALSGAHLGDVGSALLAGNAAQAKQFANEWAALFNNRFYLEVQRAGFAVTVNGDGLLAVKQ